MTLDEAACKHDRVVRVRETRWMCNDCAAEYVPLAELARARGELANAHRIHEESVAHLVERCNRLARKCNEEMFEP